MHGSVPANKWRIEWGVPPRKIPVPQLQELLVRQGAYLGAGIAEQVAARR